MGASLKPRRYSYLAVKRLVNNGFETVGFGRVGGTLESAKITSNLEEIKRIGDIHTITLYLNKNQQEPYYEFIQNLLPERVIFNPGTENPEFEAALRQAGIEAIQACTLVMLATGTY